jgi:hypothetical protein
LHDTLAQGDPRLLATEQALRLLGTSIPARLAFIWTDGTPRVIPTWFHWTGTELVMPTYVRGPAVGIQRPAQRLAALRARPDVALTIDTDTSRPDVLLIRGRATVTEVDGVLPEFALAARRYLGEEAGAALAATAAHPQTRMARIAVRPTWVGLLDFKIRLPAVRGGILPG